MTAAPNEVSVTMLLCDAAQAVGGKLFILGAAWNGMAANVPTPMALAVRVLVPWDQANQPFNARIGLVTAEGEEVDLGQGPIVAESKIEVGRPVGLPRGSALVAVFALNAGALALDAGGYVWVLELDGTVMARETFNVVDQAKLGG